MEILAPAGSRESLEAAVRAGADAVYLGASRFSARANARNFDLPALRDAVAYCRARGVRVHLALNTLLLDSELPQALALVQYACSLPVDAVLVQDPGLLRCIRLCAPKLPVHASTQMSLHTPAGVRAVQEAGCVRAVLSRELSLQEIREISDSVPGMELETFVHGALCMSVSGQCYFSSVLGARSGNRGLCAQPCRLPFSVPGGTGHDLSLKDLSMIQRMKDLEQAGVVSAKIEGRMKRPEYVAAAVSACRRAADGQPVPPSLLEDLESVFSRSGFTCGYPDGVRGREMFGIRSKEDVTAATSEVFRRLHALYKEEAARVPLEIRIWVEEGRPVRMEALDPEGRRAFAEGDPPEKALRVPLTEERCAAQLSKTGGTPFLARTVVCRIGAGLTVPLSLLNRLRRQVLDSLLEQRSRAPSLPFTPLETILSSLPDPVPRPAGNPLPLRARFYGWDLPEEAKRCQICWLPWETPLSVLLRLQKEGFPVGLELPRGLFGLSRTAARHLREVRKAGVLHVWAGTLDAVQLGKEAGMRVHGGFSLNAVNRHSLAWLREMGLEDTEVSFELTLSQACRLGDSLPRGLVVYGRLPLMLTRNCPAANGPKGCLHCRAAGKTPVLTDRKGIRFPVQCTGSCSEVLNSLPLELSDRLGQLEGLHFGTLRFTTETREQAGAILRRYVQGLPPEGEFTRGLYRRGFSQGMESSGTAGAGF